MMHHCVILQNLEGNLCMHNAHMQPTHTCFTRGKQLATVAAASARYSQLPLSQGMMCARLHERVQLRARAGGGALRQLAQQRVQAPPAGRGGQRRAHARRARQVCLHLLQLPARHACASASADTREASRQLRSSHVLHSPCKISEYLDLPDEHTLLACKAMQIQSAKNVISIQKHQSTSQRQVKSWAVSNIQHQSPIAKPRLMPLWVMVSGWPQDSASSHAGCSHSRPVTARAAAKRAWRLEAAASPQLLPMHLKMYLRAVQAGPQ